MAEFGRQETLTLKAAADLSGKQYHFMRYIAGQTMNQASQAAHALNIGVLQTKPKSDENGTVAYAGLSKVVAGGSVTDGVLITTNGSGRATAVASGGLVLGRALQGATGDGQVITVLLQQPAFQI